MSEISLSLLSEGAEVTYGTRIQAKEQINGFGSLFFKDS